MREQNGDSQRYEVFQNLMLVRIAEGEQETGLTHSQVSNWLINYRRRCPDMHKPKRRVND